jgi:ArsR family transcriptional regulator, arsenate/arsenite/antimonite-responsive transcriptional repressor / arsenate reductase (thioredoxin)
MVPPVQPSLQTRAERFAALGDPVRLAIVDELAVSDRAPVELRRRLGIESNLLAHHLDVLEAVGLITRSRSSGDGRRRYVHLVREVHDRIGARPTVRARRALFVCTRNSARSQLAAALWRDLTKAPADSAGTHPAERIDPGAVRAAQRAGLRLGSTGPQALATLKRRPDLVITVCDQAHEALDAPERWWHWSIPDPVPVGTRAAFDTTVAELRDRIRAVVAHEEPA